MTAHELAKELLAGPDLPVIINGWGSCEGMTYEVTAVLDPEPNEWIGKGGDCFNITKGSALALQHE